MFKYIFALYASQDFTSEAGKIQGTVEKGNTYIMQISDCRQRTCKSLSGLVSVAVQILKILFPILKRGNADYLLEQSLKMIGVGISHLSRDLRD